MYNNDVRSSLRVLLTAVALFSGFGLNAASVQESTASTVKGATLSFGDMFKHAGFNIATAPTIKYGFRTGVANYDIATVVAHSDIPVALGAGFGFAQALRSDKNGLAASGFDFVAAYNAFEGDASIVNLYTTVTFPLFSARTIGKSGIADLGRASALGLGASASYNIYQTTADTIALFGSLEFNTRFNQETAADSIWSGLKNNVTKSEKIAEATTGVSYTRGRLSFVSSVSPELILQSKTTLEGKEALRLRDCFSHTISLGVDLAEAATDSAFPLSAGISLDLKSGFTDASFSYNPVVAGKIGFTF